MIQLLGLLHSYTARFATNRRHLLPHLPRSHNLILRRSQFLQCKGSAAMQLLRADAHLRAEAEFSAVGEARRRIPVDVGGIDQAKESARIGFAGGDDYFG